MKEPVTQSRMNRRSAIKWMLAAAASVPLVDVHAQNQMNTSTGTGYGLDPDLLRGEVPWDRIMAADQLRTTGHLADVILPHTSDTSPSATEVHVPDFIDEWISAPYPQQEEDRPVILQGLAWLDRESGVVSEKIFMNWAFHRRLLSVKISVFHPMRFPSLPWVRAFFPSSVN